MWPDHPPDRSEKGRPVLEPDQPNDAHPRAADHGGDRPVHLAGGGAGVGIVDEFNGWLRLLVERNGSDLHVKVGTPPKMRESGALLSVERPPLSHDEMEAIGRAIVPPERVERLQASGEVDFAYSLPGVVRFRVNVFRQRGSISAVLHKLRFGGPSFEEIGLPDVIGQLADEQRGLVLVTGPTGPTAATTAWARSTRACSSS